ESYSSVNLSGNAGLFSREDAVIRIQGNPAQAFGHSPVGCPAPTVAPGGARHLFQPIVKVDLAQGGESFRGQGDLLAGYAIAKLVTRSASVDRLIERGPVHGAVQVAQPLGPLADELSHLGPAIQIELEALELLRAVDGVKHPGPAQFLVAV